MDARPPMMGPIWRNPSFLYWTPVKSFEESSMGFSLDADDGSLFRGSDFHRAYFVLVGLVAHGRRLRVMDVTWIFSLPSLRPRTAELAEKMRHPVNDNGNQFETVLELLFAVWIGAKFEIVVHGPSLYLDSRSLIRW